MQLQNAAVEKSYKEAFIKYVCANGWGLEWRELRESNNRPILRTNGTEYEDRGV